MEGGEAEKGSVGGSSSGGGVNNNTNSRWNPTKEQISMLENLYTEGIRTPSAEQIEQITARLRAYGQIEGKNVFYWFQNHKARQRQRQRERERQSQQQRLFFNNRFLHNTHHPLPFNSPLSHNVVCGPPYLLAQSESDFGIYQQIPNVILPGPLSPRTENDAGPMMMMMMRRMYEGPPIYEPWQERIPVPDYGICNSNRKTLDLFPQHPTGITEGKTTDNVVSAETSSAVVHETHPCFDFFPPGNGTRDS